MASPAPPAGRFAPSPTGDLHLGNLRTALLAWLFARTTGRRFLVRVEDLDQVRTGAAARATTGLGPGDGTHGTATRQLADLAALGLDWDGEVVYQSDRRDRYDAALAALAEAGLTYECWCSRRDIAEAASAPQSAERAGARAGAGAGAPDAPAAPTRISALPRAYPGTCRNLTEAQRAERRSWGRPAAIRLRAGVASYTVSDYFAGEIRGPVDDFVLRRGDGVPAYNLAVVVDDAAQDVDQVVRGDDLLDSAPRQAYLADLLGLPAPEYAHVPLVLGPTGARLAKRDGAVTIAALGRPALPLLAVSLGLAAPGEPVTAAELLRRFDPALLPREPWQLSRETLRNLG